MQRYAESNELTGNDYTAVNMSGTSSPNHLYNLSDITRTLRETFALGGICAAEGCGRSGTDGAHVYMCNDRGEIFPCLVTFCRRHNHRTNTNPIPLRSGARYRELF